MKMIISIIAVIVCVFVIFAVAKDVVIKSAVENGVGIVTGLNLHLQSLKVGILKPVVSIQNLRLMNPDGFKDRIMLDMPEIYVEYYLRDIMKGLIHLGEVRIELKEFNVIKNEKGVLNLDSLSVVKDQKSGHKSKEEENLPKVRIDTLKLKVSKVVYKDYSKGSAPLTQEFSLDLDATYTDIDDPVALVGLIVTKTLMRTTVGNLANIDLGGLDKTVTQSLLRAANVSEAAVQGASQTVNTTTQTLKDTGRQLGKALNVFGGDNNK